MLQPRFFAFATLLALAGLFAPSAAHAAQISVTASGSPGAAVFTITGSGFPPNTGVRIQGTRTDNLQSGSAVTTSTSTGTIQLMQSIPNLPSGLVVNFAATTDGVHWTPFVAVSAP